MEKLLEDLKKSLDGLASGINTLIDGQKEMTSTLVDLKGKPKKPKMDDDKEEEEEDEEMKALKASVEKLVARIDNHEKHIEALHDTLNKTVEAVTKLVEGEPK